MVCQFSTIFIYIARGKVLIIINIMEYLPTLDVCCPFPIDCYFLQSGSKTSSIVRAAHTMKIAPMKVPWAEVRWPTPNSWLCNSQQAIDIETSPKNADLCEGSYLFFEVTQSRLLRLGEVLASYEILDSEVPRITYPDDWDLSW